MPAFSWNGNTPFLHWFRIVHRDTIDMGGMVSEP